MIRLTEQQVRTAAGIVADHGWTSTAAVMAVDTIGLTVDLPHQPCWANLAGCGLTLAIVQVALELDDTPDGLRVLDLGGGTLPDGTELPDGLEVWR